MEQKIKELVEFYKGLISQSQFMLRNNPSNDDKIKLGAAINSLQFVIDDLSKILNEDNFKRNASEADEV